MTRGAILLAAACLSASGAARAQPGAFVMSGRCVHFSVGAKDMTAGCTARLINANNSRGQTAFLFSFTDGAFFSFEGIGARQVKLGQ